MRWTFARPLSAIARSARRPRSLKAIRRFHEAGTRHVILDFVGPYEKVAFAEIERFAGEALPLLADLRRP